MADLKRTHKLLTVSVVKEVIVRLQAYLAAESGPPAENADILKGIAARSCGELADFLRGKVVVTTDESMAEAMALESEKTLLEAEIEMLRRLVPKAKLKAHDKKMMEPVKASD